MKRNFLLLFLIAVTSSLITNAQIKKGTIFLGGAVGGGYSKGSAEPYATKQTSVSISPAYGVFTKENIVWGGDLYFQHNKSEYNNAGANTDQKQIYAGAGVFVRQYFPVANRFYLYGQARLGVYYQHDDNINASATTKTRGYGVSVALHPGITYALKKNIYLETGLNNLVSVGYGHLKTTQTGTVTTTGKSNSFGFNGNTSGGAEITVGIRFLLERSAG
jgi:outer membrane protein assembly factor BamA